MKEFFKNFGCGAIMGVAVLVPGVSAGTVAVLLNIYDKMISSINNLGKDFKNSFKFLLPIILGIIVGFVAIYFPLDYAIKYAPMPTVLLFVGLMLGTFPKLIKDTAKMGFKKLNILSIILPLAAVIGMCFIPNIGNVNLDSDMPIQNYFILVLIGALAAGALFVPGISGSMILMIFGYYEPILDTISALFTDFGHSVAVLGLFALGVIIGFFSITKLMKLLLDKFPRGTRWAIIGFIVGSIPAILITFDYASAPLDAWQIAIAVILCIGGGIGSFFFTRWSDKRIKKSEAQSAPEEIQNPEN